MKNEESFFDARNAMVRDQLMRRGVEDTHVLEAFKAVPRHYFVEEDYISQAYSDHPLPIGFGQTISQPYIVALMTESLDLHGHEKVLEVGTGSGYQTAILAHLAKEVYTIELVKDLSRRAETIFKKLGYRNIFVEIGDGSVGLPKHQPYDRIIITAAVPFLPQDLKEQLKIGGKLVAPIGERWQQTLEVWKREEKRFIKEKILPVVFVPLRGKFGWQD